MVFNFDQDEPEAHPEPEEEIPAEDEFPTEEGRQLPIEEAAKILGTIAGAKSPSRPGTRSPAPRADEPKIRFYRERWFVVLTTFLCTPLALLIIWTGPVYYWRRGDLRTFSGGTKWTISILSFLILPLLIFSPPDRIKVAEESRPAPAAPPRATAGSASSLEVGPTQSRQAAAPAPSAPPVAASSPASRTVAVGPSFDCGRAQDGVGATICSNAMLRRLDSEFVQVFYALRHQLGDEQTQTMRQDAVAFHQFVIQTCQLPRTVTPGQNLSAGVACVAETYRNKRADYLRWLKGDALEEASRDILQHIALQARLVDLGALPAGSAIDGIYGPATRTAIMRLQLANGLPPSGFVTNDTARIMQGTPAQAAAASPASAGMPSFNPQAAIAEKNTAAAAPARTPLLFATGLPSQSYLPGKAQEELNCFAGWYESFQAGVTRGAFVTLDMTGDKPGQRTCTAAALCDLIDGRPNLMTLLSQSTASDYNAACRGAEHYGPPMIAREQAVFERLLRPAAASMPAASPPQQQRPAAFTAYPAGPIYRGPIVYPDFNGRDRDYRSYRTRIREGMAAGTNFAGHLALITIGCGTGCRFAYIGDVASGRVHSFPLGGEETMYLSLDHRPDSNLVIVTWEADDRCMSEALVWNGTTLTRGGARHVGSTDTPGSCP